MSAGQVVVVTGAAKPGGLGRAIAERPAAGGARIVLDAVCPNPVTAALGAWQNEFFSGRFGFSLDACRAAMRQRIPLGRSGTPFDTAAACAFLAGDAAACITGEVLNVSGGEEMH